MIRSGTIAFLIGILFFQQLTELPVLNSYYFLLLLPFFVYFPRPFQLLGLGIAGFLWVFFNAQLLLSDTLPASLEGKDILLEGQIVSLPVKRPNRIQFDFAVTRLVNEKDIHHFPATIRLNWYRTHTLLRAGQVWRLKVRLKRPYGMMNPGGFDYEAWLFQHRIQAKGYVRSSDKNQLLAAATVASWLNVRQIVFDKLQQLALDPQATGLIQALVVGERQGVLPEQWVVFKRTGTIHLMAISGLHIGLMAGLAYALMFGMWRLSSRACLFMPAPQAAAIGAWLIAFCYAQLAGFSIPTQRALIMVTIVLIGVIRRRQQPASISLAIALLLVLIHDPLAVMAQGFWLSFMAVGIILFALQGRRQVIQATLLLQVLRYVRLQWFIVLGLMPLVLMFNQSVSLVSVAANLLAIPLMSFLLLPMLMAGSVLLFVSEALAATIFSLATQLINFLWHSLEFIARWPHATWEHALPGSGFVLIAVLAILLVLAPRGVPAKWIGLWLFLPLFLSPDNALRQGEMQFSVLDVGQGLSAVVQTARHVLVFDTGPRYSERFDTGRAVVVPFLRTQGIQYIDRLIVSHGDNDHIGGLDSIARIFEIKQIQTSVPDRISPVIANHVAVEVCQPTQWVWDGVIFNLLHPARAQLLATVLNGHDDNNRSCVLKIEARSGTVLLTGDIEQAAEAELLARYPGSLDVDVLVAPHHGSNTSSTADFINRTSAKYVIMPVGYRNRYRLPNYKVVARYLAQTDVVLLNTAQMGAIQFKFTRQAIGPPASYRQQQQRYWHTRWRAR